MDWRGLKEWGDDTLRVIFPLTCEVCGSSLLRGEEVMCLHCNADMPRTQLHHEEFNTLHQRLAGKAPIERAAGYFYYYPDSDYAKMIQRAKYNGRPRIVAKLAERYVSELTADVFFDGIDLVQPVPMHWIKKVRRGYNQSEEIARSISRATGIAMCDCLRSTHSRATQTRKNRFERWINTREAYTVKRVDTIVDKHILLVDDVITTGATILACCEAIHATSPTTRLSVLTLGVTHLR